jgi:uncharacterized protein (TIGR04222 family)
LLARVEAQPLCAPGDPLAFECRLADDNGWTFGHAVRVVREYRRFLVLTQVAGTQACPSDDVDQAWLLHTARHADYERFCTSALGRVPRRDGPPPADANGATRARYRTVFGSDAPSAVWPPGGTRLAGVGRARAIRLTGVLARPAVVLSAHAASGVALGVAAGLLGTFSRVDTRAEDLVGGLGLAVLLGGWLASWVATWRGGRTDARDEPDVYETAWMAGGPRRVAATALGTLAQRGVLVLKVCRRRWKTPTAVLELAASASRHAEDHPAERACRAGDVPGAVSFDEARARVARWSSATGRRLAQAGLVVGADELDSVRAILLGVAWLVLAVAAGCAVNDARLGRPDQGLVILAIGAVALAARVLLWMSRLTPHGRSVLDTVGARERRRPPAASALDDARRSWSLALEGAVAMMNDPRFEGIEGALGYEGVPNDD